jgi:hypothetical protein
LSFPIWDTKKKKKLINYCLPETKQNRKYKKEKRKKGHHFLLSSLFHLVKNKRSYNNDLPRNGNYMQFSNNHGKYTKKKKKKRTTLTKYYQREFCANTHNTFLHFVLLFFLLSSTNGQPFFLLSSLSIRGKHTPWILGYLNINFIQFLILNTLIHDFEFKILILTQYLNT